MNKQFTLEQRISFYEDRVLKLKGLLSDGDMHPLVKNCVERESQRCVRRLKSLRGVSTVKIEKGA